MSWSFDMTPTLDASYAQYIGSSTAEILSETHDSLSSRGYIQGMIYNCWWGCCMQITGLGLYVLSSSKPCKVSKVVLRKLDATSHYPCWHSGHTSVLWSVQTFPSSIHLHFGNMWKCSCHDVPFAAGKWSSGGSTVWEQGRGSDPMHASFSDPKSR